VTQYLFRCRWFLLAVTAISLVACGRNSSRLDAGSGGSSTNASVGGSAGSTAQTGSAEQGGSAWAGQGGQPQGGSSFGGLGGDRLDGAAEAGGTGDSDLFPLCSARGGDCVLMQEFSQPCPQGTYNPFSGLLALCPTNTIQRCCVPTGKLGSTCSSDNPCDNGGCATEQSGYPVGGYCAGACTPAASSCPSWGTCIPVVWSEAPGICMVPCSNRDMCREGWSCEAFPLQPFRGTGGDVVYVCWQAGSVGKGLGTECVNDRDCLSQLCRPDAQQTSRCSAACDDGHPCLTGSHCHPRSGCTTPGCGNCMPD
jgi:hypothetical protein